MMQCSTNRLLGWQNKMVGKSKRGGLPFAFGGVKALNGVGFDVTPGSITTVIGLNGAGRVSLLNTIAGFCRPSQGVVRFKGTIFRVAGSPQRVRLGLARHQGRIVVQ